MKKLDAVLSAVVTFIPATSGKVKTATFITITLAGLKVATATKGNRYSQEAALKEFKANPKSFVLADGYAIAKGLGLVA